MDGLLPQPPQFASADIRLSEEVEADGDALLRIACEHDLEGIIAKRRDWPIGPDGLATG